ncbi:MAG: phenylalanine--tRNA ligase subunit alpha [Actinomycetota bacterium]
MRRRFSEVRAEGLERIAQATDLASLDDARVRVLGRKGPLSEARSGLRDVPSEERAAMGQLANEVQSDLERALDEKRTAFEAVETKARWERERIDVTLPPPEIRRGYMHLLTQTLWEIVDIFIGLGYKVVEGPEVEFSKLNFDALNTPYEHPSRSPQDTFFVAGTDEEICLRTQTSPVQIRVMESKQPPIYGVFPGRVYRRDDLDATHTAQFFQMEALAVDEGITMGDLKGTLEIFAHQLFGGDLQVRLRPHFFPFTEPSAEMDVECFVCRGAGCRTCKGEGWIEILGCGMVHPKLFEWVGYDAERFTGFAFGMGIERITALAHGIPDIRVLYDNDLRVASQFGGLR